MTMPLHKPWRSVSVSRVMAAIFILAATMPARVPAASYTWDASGGTPLDDGGGAWNSTGGTNWFNGTTFGAWGNTTSDLAVFGVGNGAAGTITVGGVTTNGITFNAPGSGTYTLTGGTITLGGTTPTITANASASIGSVLAGSAGLTKSGSGTLALSGLSAASANNYSGTTIIDGGGLAIASAGTAALSGRLTFGATAGSTNVGSLDLTSASASFGGLTVQTNSSGTNTITIGNGQTLTTTGSVAIGIAAPATASTTQLNVTGAGGAWIVNNSGGSFQVGLSTTGTGDRTGVNLSGLGSFTANLGSAGTFRVGSRTTDQTNGPASLTLAAGTNTITAGTLGVGDVSGDASTPGTTLNLGANATNTLNVNTINVGYFNGGSARGKGTLQFSGAGSGSVKIRAADQSSATALNMIVGGIGTGSGIPASFDVTGHSADLLLSTVDILNVSAPGGGYTATFSFDSGTLISGTFKIGTRTGGANAAEPSATVNVGSSSNLANTFSLGVVQIAQMSSAAGRIKGTLNIAGNNTSGTISSISLGGATQVGGTSTATLSITGGTTTLLGDITVSNTTGTVNSTLALNGGLLNMSGSSIGGANRIGTLNFQSGELRNVKEINNGAGLTKTTAGTLRLSGTNAYSGTTSVSAGVLTISSTDALPGWNTAGRYTTAAGAALVVGNNVTDAAFDTIRTTGSYAANAAIGFDTTAGNRTYAGTAIANPTANALGLVKIGVNTLTMSVANTYTGTTTVSAGVLRLDNATALPGGIGSTGGSSPLTIDGGVIGLGNGNFSRGLGTGATQVQIIGGGGFAAYGADRTVNLGGNGTPLSLTWGSSSFITAGSGTGTFVLGAADATNTVDFQNPIALGSAARTVQVDNGSADVDATLSGVVSSVTAGNGLTKTGAGTLSLLAANTFNGTLGVQNGVVRFSTLAAGSGAQNLGAGTIVNLGLAATSSGEIDYRGSGGTLDKNISALGNGRNRIRNSGAGTLTLTGTLTKDGTILELAGGTFSVSGRITGTTVGTSDLYVNGATVTLSSTNNDYNGPTYVYGGGSITLGANNVIPSNSALLLGGTGSDTGSGTINTGTLTDAIASLTSSSLGSTIGITINRATAGGLSMGNLAFGSGTDTLALTLTSPSAVRYTLLTYTGARSGTFDSVTGAGNYNVVYGNASNGTIDLQLKANQSPTFTMTTGTITRALVNTTLAVSGTVTNSSPAGSAVLTLGLAATGLSGSGFTTGSVTADSSLAVSGTLNSGPIAGTQAWSITNTDTNAITTVSTATGSLQVVNQRSFTVTSSTIALGRYLITNSAPTGTTGITSTGSNATTANATVGGFSSSDGYTLGLTSGSGSNVFNGATGSQTAAYSISGTATIAGLLSGVLSSTVTAEFGSISPVQVNYTANPVNQRSFTVTGGTMSLGMFLRTISATGSATISSNGLYDTTATASLAGFSGTNTNGFGLGLATGTNVFDGGSAFQQAVYSLSGSAASAGAINGSFTSNVSSEFGAITPLTVVLTGTALDPALPSWTPLVASDSLLAINFGELNQASGSVSQNFDIWNLVQMAGYTADLDLVSITSGTGNFSEITTTLAQFSGLVAGDSRQFSTSLSLGTLGTFTNTYTLAFTSSKNGTPFNDSPRSLSLTVTGIIVVPEPGSLALAGIGVAAAAWALRRRK